MRATLGCGGEFDDLAYVPTDKVDKKICQEFTSSEHLSRTRSNIDKSFPQAMYELKEKNSQMWSFFGPNTTYGVRNQKTVDILGEIGSERVFEFAGNGGFVAQAAVLHPKLRKTLKTWLSSEFSTPVLDYAAFLFQSPNALFHPERDPRELITSEWHPPKYPMTVSHQTYPGHQVELTVQRIDMSDIATLKKCLGFQQFDSFVTISMEHFGNDLEIITAFPVGSHFVFGLAGFDDIEHFRYFEGEDEITQRYSGYLEIVDIYRLSHNAKFKFVVHGIVQEPCNSRGSITSGGYCACDRRFIGRYCEGAVDDFLGRPGIGADVFQRYSYLTHEAMQIRQKQAALFLNEMCRNVLEFGGFLTPIHGFIFNPRIKTTNVDPLSPPTLQKDDEGVWFRRTLTMDFADFIPEGNEDCFVFLGFDCRSIGNLASIKSLIRRMNLIVLETARGMDGVSTTHDLCFDDILNDIKEHGFRMIYQKNLFKEISAADENFTKQTQPFRRNRELFVFMSA